MNFRLDSIGNISRVYTDGNLANLATSTFKDFGADLNCEVSTKNMYNLPTAIGIGENIKNNNCAQVLLEIEPPVGSGGGTGVFKKTDSGSTLNNIPGLATPVNKTFAAYLDDFEGNYNLTTKLSLKKTGSSYFCWISIL